RVDLDDLMEPLPIDKVAVYQVFLNLVSNAVDACVDSASGDLVKIKSHDRGEDLLFTIEDNGIGMSEDTARRVFDRFYTTKSAKGTGLGLPVAKKIVEAHGGNIEVRSSLGVGTTFFVQLSKTPPTGAESSSPKNP
ncbi:MAG: sensor histidine kinase, partial [Candidatus Latescibacterota bacterium]